MYPPAGITVVGVNVTVTLASALFSRRSRGSIPILAAVTDVCAATCGGSSSTDAAKIEKASCSIANDVSYATALSLWPYPRFYSTRDLFVGVLLGDCSRRDCRKRWGGAARVSTTSHYWLPAKQRNRFPFATKKIPLI